jgi:hypothetical protein
VELSIGTITTILSWLLSISSWTIFHFLGLSMICLTIVETWLFLTFHQSRIINYVFHCQDLWVEHFNCPCIQQLCPLVILRLSRMVYFFQNWIACWYLFSFSFRPYPRIE